MEDPYNRCDWGAKTPLTMKYHDERWCKPMHEEQELFAMLSLEIMSSGLSWSLILDKETGMRQAFDQFNPEVVATYDQPKIDELLKNPSIIRNTMKVNAIVQNAKAFLAIVQEIGSFDAYIWSFSDYQPIVHHATKLKDIPAQSKLSETISKDFKKRGFRFVGPVIVYSYLQSIGIYNDHLEGCPWKYTHGQSRK